MLFITATRKAPIFKKYLKICFTKPISQGKGDEKLILLIPRKIVTVAIKLALEYRPGDYGFLWKKYLLKIKLLLLFFY